MSLYEAAPKPLSIPQGCPWHDAQVEYGTPNVDWCEPTVCSYINEPANTWSNLAFLLVGVMILKKITGRLTTKFAWIVIVMGSFSAIYHASNNYLTQHLDFLGMSLMTSYFLALGAVRLNQKFNSLMAWYWFFVSANVTTLLFLGILDLPIQTLLALNATPIIVLESILYFKAPKKLKMSYFIISIVTLIVAQVFAQIDLKRIYCKPESLFLHGHVMWHLLCAVSMYFAALHMREHSRMIEQ